MRVRAEDRARARYDIVRLIARDILKSTTVADLLIILDLRQGHYAKAGMCRCSIVPLSDGLHAQFDIQKVSDIWGAVYVNITRHSQCRLRGHAGREPALLKHIKSS